MTHPDPIPAARPRVALVVGATGSFGGHVAAALLKRGWSVRGLTRDPAAASRKAGAAMPIDWIAGDALRPADVAGAARGASVIVHAANPPGYRNWAGLVLPMFRSTLAAAKAQGARIVLPGNVYNYAPDLGPRIAEDAPQNPGTRKGAIRVQMERELEVVSRDGARGLIVRAGDFFGPGGEGTSWLPHLIGRRGGRVTRVLLPGPADVGHAFAYLPDLAETTARLIDREGEIADFERFHFAGHWLSRLDELSDAVRRVTARPRLPVGAFPWPLMVAASPFVEMCREMMEMRYLWKRPIGLDDARLRAFLGDVPATSLDTAVRETLSDLGALGGSAAKPSEARSAWGGTGSAGLRAMP
jgi:nucleoside-diphosphate-sugar epimerase